MTPKQLVASSTALRGVVAALALTSSAAFIAPSTRTTAPLAARRSAGTEWKFGFGFRIRGLEKAHDPKD